jgi:hypothetical protein
MDRKDYLQNVTSALESKFEASLEGEVLGT